MDHKLVLIAAALFLGAASPALARTPARASAPAPAPTPQADAAKQAELKSLLNCGVAYQAYGVALAKTTDPDASALVNQFKLAAPGLAGRIDILADAVGEENSTRLAQEAVDGWNHWLTNNSGKADWPADAIKTYQPTLSRCVATAQRYK